MESQSQVLLQRIGAPVQSVKTPRFPAGVFNASTKVLEKSRFQTLAQGAAHAAPGIEGAGSQKKMP
eukprot:4071599-Pyramimonas_sp.AAC.1